MTVFCETCGQKLRLSVRDNFLVGIVLFFHCRKCKLESYANIALKDLEIKNENNR
jgi:hypothetical protein